MLAFNAEYLGLPEKMRLDYESILQRVVSELYDTARGVAELMGKSSRSFGDLDYTIKVSTAIVGKQRFTNMTLSSHCSDLWVAMRWGCMYPTTDEGREDFWVYAHYGKPRRQDWVKFENEFSKAEIFMQASRNTEKEYRHNWSAQPHRLNLRCPLIFDLENALGELTGDIDKPRQKPISANLKAYLRLESVMLTLDTLDEAAADVVRDVLDPLWLILSKDEIESLNGRVLHRSQT